MSTFDRVNFQKCRKILIAQILALEFRIVSNCTAIESIGRAY